VVESSSVKLERIVVHETKVLRYRYNSDFSGLEQLSLLKIKNFYSCFGVAGGVALTGGRLYFFTLRS